MKKRSIIVLMGFCWWFGVVSGQTFQWAKLFTGADDSRAKAVVADGQGNVYVVGTFYATVDFDPGVGTFNMTSNGSADGFLVKLNAIGGFVWAKQFGGITTDDAQSVAVDAAGNPHIISTFYSTVDYDPGPATYNFTANTYSDVAVVKLDPNGNLIWAKQFAGTDYDFGRAITVDASGNVYTTGYFIYTCDFDPGPGVANVTANGTIEDVFISKLDINGNYVWAKRFGGPWGDAGYAIAVNSAMEVIISGQFEGTADFDPGSGTFNMSTNLYQPEAFYCKLSSTGGLMWAKEIDAGSSSNSYALGLDASGNVYGGGVFGSTSDFDPGSGTYNLTANNGFDAYLLKLTGTGTFVWAKAISGGGTSESVQELSVTSSGVYYTGYFSGTVDFNPGAATANLTALGTQDFFVGKLDLSGNYVSAFRIGNASNTNNGYGIYANNAGNVYTVGLANGTSDFDPGSGTTNLTTVGYSDAFVQKLSLCAATSASSTASACSSYTLGGNTYTTSGTYTARIPNAAGCDSVITLNLTIRQPSASTITQNLCASSFTLNSQTYTGSGTYTQHLTNAAGCDSAITLNLTLRQASASTITQNVCGTSFTLNNQTYTTSGTYTQHLTNSAGCDSAITLNLILRPASSATISQTACTSFMLNNQTYTSSGTYTQLLTNSLGCDSTLTLNLTIHQPTTEMINQTACGSYTLNSQTYSSSGTYTQTLTNAVGCDSTLTLNLILLQPTTATLTQTACDSFALNNQSYSSSGTYSQVLTNAAGCDSTITLTLTVLQSTTASLTASACDAYALNGQTYSSTGTYVQTLTNAAGCDSVLTLSLTVGTTPVAGISQNGNVLTSSPGGLGYQWLDCDNGMSMIPNETGQSFAPTVSGNYAVVVSDGNCSDTSACAFVNLVGMEPAGLTGFTIFPNPTNGSFIVKFETIAASASIGVYDMLGKLMVKKEFSQTQIVNLDLEAASGVYWVIVTMGDARFTRKLLLQ